MAQTGRATRRDIRHYRHLGKERLNNPPVGLVTPDTDRDTSRKKYAYDPHLDPQLVWAGKAERTSFEVPTVSLHVHERIEPHTIIEAVQRRNGDEPQLSLFAQEQLPIRQEIQFYKHKRNWSNRLIAGDSLLVMNSLLEKEGMAGQVQMIYIDPPYGIAYRSNFQPFINKRDVAEGDKDEDLTAEPETLKAFRDTWELGIHSYCSYLRDRLLLAKELLHERGSCFVQISDENLHIVRAIMDEIFGADRFVVTFSVKKKGSQKSSLIDPVNDYIIWYGKSPRGSGQIKFRPLYEKRKLDAETLSEFRFVELPDGSEHPISAVPGLDGKPIDYRLRPRQLFRDHPKARLFRPNPLKSGGYRRTQSVPFEFEGKVYEPGPNRCWKVSAITDDGSPSGMQRLAWAGRIIAQEGDLRFRSYLDDFGYVALSNWWDNLGGAKDPIYVVQTNTEIVKRCMLMTTDPGDLVFDPTCGSGTTAYVAEEWGRRWITTDSSRVAITLSKQRLMTAVFDYYQLAHPEEGVGSGFQYETVPHVELGQIANNSEIREGMSKDAARAAIRRGAKVKTLYDKPLRDAKRARVSGPFTVEAVPAPSVRPINEIDGTEVLPADEAIARTGETARQADWRDEMLKNGIRGKGGQHIQFARVEPLPGTSWLHADAETKEDNPQRVMISFGPDHAPLEQRQVALALDEAQQLVPRPKIIVFAAFQFDPEAQKDIDETNWPGVILLKAQMNADLLTEDLKKKRASNDSFWLIGQPDTELLRIKDGPDAGKYRVSVSGFDYYDTRTGNIVSGGSDKIAMWLLDPDYDGRSLFPRQVFFPLAGPGDGWGKLANSLKTEINEELIEAYRGTVSLPFEPGMHGRLAIKIIDDRGVESLVVRPLREGKSEC